MDTNLFNEYSKQVGEWQQKFFNTWMESFLGESERDNLSETWKTTLNRQQDWVNVALKVQELGIDIALGTQRELWRSYFELFRNSP